MCETYRVYLSPKEQLAVVSTKLDLCLGFDFERVEYSDFKSAFIFMLKLKLNLDISLTQFDRLKLRQLDLDEDPILSYLYDQLVELALTTDKNSGQYSLYSSPAIQSIYVADTVQSDFYKVSNEIYPSEAKAYLALINIRNELAQALTTYEKLSLLQLILRSHNK